MDSITVEPWMIFAALAVLGAIYLLMPAGC
jgi:hypothetical protein